ncbi:2400_t:CDS:1, partial [Dentiscutata heterogama]
MFSDDSFNEEDSSIYSSSFDKKYKKQKISNIYTSNTQSEELISTKYNNPVNSDNNDEYYNLANSNHDTIPDMHNNLVNEESSTLPNNPNNVSSLPNLKKI